MKAPGCGAPTASPRQEEPALVRLPPAPEPTPLDPPRRVSATAPSGRRSPDGPADEGAAAPAGGEEDDEAAPLKLGNGGGGANRKAAPRTLGK